MATISGISAMLMGDGAGGNAALDVNKAILRMLRDDNSFAFRTATIKNPNQVNAGTVAYHIPEMVQAEDYGTGTSDFQIPQSGLKEIHIDTKRTVKWTWETFDTARLGDYKQVIDMIAVSLASSIQADLNAHFWAMVVEKLTKDTAMKKQNLVMTSIGKTDGTATEAGSRKDMYNIEMLIAKLSKKFDKTKLGIPKGEFLVYMSKEADVNLRYSFTQYISGFNYAMAPTLEGVQIGNFKYMTDPMLQNAIAAGSSFSKDKTLDTTNLVGAVVHNEAIAMPMNLYDVVQIIDPDNGDPKFIAKYQFGADVIRPDLVYGFVLTAPK